MAQFYIRVSKNDKTTGEHNSDDATKASAVFEEMKKTAPVGSKIDLRDFSLAESLIDTHIVKVS